MSMIPRDPSDNSVVVVAEHAGAGALVLVISVLAVYLVLQTVITALITLAAVIVIGAILWLVFLRKRFKKA